MDQASDKLMQSGSLSQEDSEANGESFKNSLLLELEKFKELNSESNIIPNAKYFIISNSWFQRWLNYILHKGYLPGKIDNSDIIEPEDTQNYYFHRQPLYQYANTILKPDLIENEDYIICTEAAYKSIDNIYTHRPPEVIRYGVQMTEESVKVEITLKKLYIYIIPEISRRQNIEKTLNVSYKEKISNIIAMLKELIGPYFDTAIFDRNTVRLWKMNRDLKLKKMLPSEEISVPGLILDSKCTVEECSIGEDDIIVMEHCKHSGRWQLITVENSLSLPKGLKTGLAGLQNLGNTCFMNSAIQCVVHSKFLKDYFLQNAFRQDLNVNNPLGSKNAELAKTFATLTKEMWEAKTSQVSPWEFKKVISKLASQFSGYQQHDSHELLSYLLSGLHEDLNRIKVKVYEELPEINSDTEDSVAAKTHWQWFKKRNQSVIVDNMYGQCKSTLVCPDCQKISITFDPVLSYGVVIPNTDIKKILINIVQQDFCKPILKIFATVKESWKVSKLKSMLFEHFSTQMQIILIEKANFLCVPKDDASVTTLFFRHIYAYEDSGEEGEFIPIIISKGGEKGYFTKSDKKVFSMPRIIKVPLSSTAAQIQALIRNKFNSLISMNENLQNPYLVNIVNTSKTVQGFFFSNKAPCDFCNKKCENCPLGYDTQKTLEELLSKRKNSEGVFQLEIEWNPQSKNLSSLNHFTDERSLISEPISQNQSISTLIECLQRSCNAEKLDENNKWYCSRCKAHVRAVKTYQLYSAPKYFILHLMRFKSKNYFSEKNNTLVDFPLEGLDLSEVVLSADKPPQYDLYAVSNHFGNIGGGHYTAFVKEEGNWFEMDDSRVTQVIPEKVVSANAYVLFYKQRGN